MKHQCPICFADYIWSCDLKRHMKTKHSQQQQQQQQYIQRPTQQQQQQNHIEQQQQQQQQNHIEQQQQDDFVFKHPFTANVSGPTSCGKTYFVKTLLQKCIAKISPAPQRIIWLYKRWQPLYDIIKETVCPPVEFVQGIPLDLDQDSFISPRITNLIVLDDLMSTASKDSRISELFTEGSHHRNLSVIAINQNLYYNKDPTQRRNCHYLVMFNNPVDKQQVMTLARQMYPENPQRLMRHFNQAVNKPYGYLLVDLKPTTPDLQRMRTDVFGDQPIKTNATSDHFKGDTPIEQSWSQQQPFPNNKDRLYRVIPRQREEEIIEMSSCDDCGLVFDDVHDLQRHIKTWCAENKRKWEEDDEDEEAPHKKSKWISYESEEEGENEEHKVFDFLTELVREKFGDKLEEKKDKYRKDGLTTKEAKDKAERKMESQITTKILKHYCELITYILQLQFGKIHRRVMDDVKEFIDEGFNQKRAVEMAVKKNRHMLEGMFDKQTDDDEEEEDDEEGEED